MKMFAIVMCLSAVLMVSCGRTPSPAPNSAAVEVSKAAPQNNVQESQRNTTARPGNSDDTRRAHDAEVARANAASSAAAAAEAQRQQQYQQQAQQQAQDNQMQQEANSQPNANEISQIVTSRVASSLVAYSSAQWGAPSVNMTGNSNGIFTYSVSGSVDAYSATSHVPLRVNYQAEVRCQRFTNANGTVSWNPTITSYFAG